MVKYNVIEQPNGCEARPAYCPRCGYDLRGTVGARPRARDDMGTCSECGLEFLWSEVLENQVLPAWSIERVEAPLHRTVFSTCGRLFLPWRMWRELGMTQRSRPRRIAAPLLVILVLVFIGFAACRAVIAAEVHRAQSASAAVPISLREAILTASFTPFSNRSLAGTGNRAWSYPSPRRLHDAFAAARGNAWNSSLEATLNGSGMIVPFLSVAIVFQVLCGLSALTVPATLRRFKVRKLHLLRVTLYSLWLLAPAAALALFFYALAVLGFTPRWLAIVPRAVWWYLLAAVPALTLAHWFYAARVYLRVPHCAALAVAVVMMSAFTTGLVVYLMVQPGSASDLFHPLTWLRALPGLIHP